MRFYGLHPKEIADLGRSECFALMKNMDRIRAREQLELLNMLTASQADAQDRQRVIIQLSEVAFGHDPRQLAIALEAATRK